MGERDGGRRDGCGLVGLKPGRYERIMIQDGRYEIYQISEETSEEYLDLMHMLLEERAEEQHKNYKCPLKPIESIPIWDSPD